MNRRTLLAGAAAAAGAGLWRPPLRATAATPLDVAYAGSMGSMMEGPIKEAAAQALGIEMHGRALGSDALAALIVGGSVPVDVFMPVTPRPMNAVLKAGKATIGIPIARTEMVIAYAPKGQFAQQFADAVAGKPGAMPWWQILEQPGLRFGRTDPVADPQGRNIIFTLQLAEAYYKQPGLATEDPRREHQHGADLLRTDRPGASAERRTRCGVGLPHAAGTVQDPVRHAAGRDQSRRPGDERPLRADLAAVGRQDLQAGTARLLRGRARRLGAPDQAAAFVDWLAKGAQPIFRQNYYDAPVGASSLRA